MQLKRFLQPTVNAMVSEGRSFTGILYAGLIHTEKGTKVIEFNARFGDPETQVVLPRLKTDFVEVLQAVLAGEDLAIEWYDEAVLGVVVAAEGYPGDVKKGSVITGLDKISADAYVYHAGTAKNDEGQFVSNGGRVLLVAAKGKDLQSAQTKVYQELENISRDGLFYRKDIGYRAIQGK